MTNQINSFSMAWTPRFKVRQPKHMVTQAGCEITTKSQPLAERSYSHFKRFNYRTKVPRMTVGRKSKNPLSFLTFISPSLLISSNVSHGARHLTGSRQSNFSVYQQSRLGGQCHTKSRSSCHDRKSVEVEDRVFSRESLAFVARGVAMHRSGMELRLLLAALLCWTCASCANTDRTMDPSNSRVWGPGVEIPDRATLPARYFFIEPRDAEGKKINESQKYDVHIIGQSRFGSCRYRLSQVDRHDGSSIIRYKLAESCSDVSIHVRHNSVHLSGSPFVIPGTLYSEQCYCPQGSVDEWLETVGCPLGDPQIDMDLIPFRAINFSSLRTRMIQQYDKPGSISHCNYVILRNQVHRRCYGQHTGFSKFMDTILLSLARKFTLPDMELFVNLGDWPLVKKGGQSRTTGPFPIFSWCGSDDTFDIVMPTYDITESTLENMGRVMLDMLSIQRKGIPWAEKHPRAFWRGRDARRERLELVALARFHPDLLNASLTNFFFFREEESEFGPRVAHISMHDFFDYRYQINVDGTVAAYRLPYLLAGSSVVLKQDSFYYEHFYRKLVPMRHYIPFEADLSNLLQQIQWARDNDDQAREIRDNANTFVNANLLPLDIYCYHALLFKEYAKYIVSPIQVQPGMEKIEQPDEAYHCPCERTTLPRDEL